MIHKATRYYVLFAGTNGKRRYVGPTDERGNVHYVMQRDAADMFATYEDAANAADAIPPRYIIKRSVPTIKETKVLVETIERSHGSLAQAMETM